MVGVTGQPSQGFEAVRIPLAGKGGGYGRKNRSKGPGAGRRRESDTPVQPV